jgi:hypothetical protein
MKRDALGRFLRRLAIAALPLCGCHNSPQSCVSDTTVDVAASSLGELPDLAGCVDSVATDCSSPVNCDTAGCPQAFTRCIVDPSPMPPLPQAGYVRIDCGGAYCPLSTAGGRRPAGLHPAIVEATTEAGALFASQGYLEAASVTAFMRLGRELAAHGAPARLIARARRAARDEARHARLMRRLSRRYGAVVPRPRVDHLAVPRTLLELAVENAVEGVVGETWGAALAHFQARAAADPEVRAAMIEIARDETEHAELAHAVARWALPQLSARERGEVKARQRKALAALAVEQSVVLSPSLRRAAGLPDRTQAAFLLAGCDQAASRCSLA